MSQVTFLTPNIVSDNLIVCTIAWNVAVCDETRTFSVGCTFVTVERTAAAMDVEVFSTHGFVLWCLYFC